MERRGSLYFSSEHTAYSPVNLGYVCEAIYDEFISCLSYYYIKRRVKKLRFSHAFYNVITYEIVSAHKGTLIANNSTLIILTGLPAQYLMAILCDEYHDFPLG